MPYLHKPKEKWNALMAGSKTGWSESVSEKMSPISNPPSRSFGKKSIDITTDRFTPPPRRSLIFVSKER
jgi:hypothetical protein